MEVFRETICLRVSQITLVDRAVVQRIRDFQGLELRASYIPEQVHHCQHWKEIEIEFPQQSPFHLWVDVDARSAFGRFTWRDIWLLGVALKSDLLLVFGFIAWRPVHDSQRHGSICEI